MRSVAIGMLCLAATLPDAAQAADVEVTLNGGREGGNLFIGLQTRDQFLGPLPDGETLVAPAGGTATVVLKDVAPGDYAIVVWHDDNKNGRFDAGAPNQPPQDGWAIANFVDPTAPPSFDQVKVAVAAQGAKVSMPMNYSR